ncbi:hypothetical protein REPUB_Repub07fG0197500 [Reevesia pubescens]
MVRTRSKRRQQHLSSPPSPRGGSETEVIDIPPSPEQNDMVTPTLSKLRPLKKPVNGSTTKIQLSENAREKYAAASKLVKEAVVMDLTSGKNQDVESLVNLANKAFTSLDVLQADYQDLYKAVEDFIAGKTRASKIENEIKEKRDLLGILSRNGQIIGNKMEDVKKKQQNMGIALWNSTQQIGDLKRRISETRSLLEELEKELVIKEICIKEQKQDLVHSEASHTCLKAEKDKNAQDAEAASRQLVDVYRHRKEVVAEIEMATAVLFSCLA